MSVTGAAAFGAGGNCSVTGAGSGNTANAVGMMGAIVGDKVTDGDVPGLAVEASTGDGVPFTAGAGVPYGDWPGGVVGASPPCSITENMSSEQCVVASSIFFTCSLYVPSA